MTSDRPGSRDTARDATIAALRRAIGTVEATSSDLVRKPTQLEEPQSARKRRPLPKENLEGTWPPITYPGMPEGDDWMNNLPARYHDGERGFDRRIMEELAAVGVRCYTVNELANRVATIPQGIPIFVDWLNHIEERIPGPETSHRTAIRAGLIRNLNDSAARGNQAAVDALVNQLRRQPPLPGPLPEYADSALGRIATKRDFSTIATLIRDMPPEFSRSGLIAYLGRVKTPEAQAIALEWLDTVYTGFAIKALVAMKAAGVRDRIAPYVEDANAWVRKSAKRAMERLPE